MTNYEKIKAACQKANPKLMELEMGCKIKFKCYTPSFTYTIARKRQVFGAGGEAWEVIEISDMIVVDRKQASYIWDTVLHELSEIEILGHEPQLSDVLMAIGLIENEKREKDGDFTFHRILLEASGHFLRNNPEISVYTVLAKYDLTKPLKDQSEETLQFIADLL